MIQDKGGLQVQIFNNLPDPALLIDPRTYIIVHANSAYVKRFGIPKKNIIGRKCHEVVHRKPAHCNGSPGACVISKALRTKKTVSEEHIHYERNNKPCEVKVTAALVRDGERGRRLAFLIIHPKETSGAAEADKKYISELKNLVVKDHLTGVYNNYYFLDRLRSEVYRSKRYGYPLSLAKIDIDYFESINETYGRKAGDQMLVAFAGFLKKMLRQSDVLARCGGEEFAIIMAHTDKIGADLAANRLINKINEQTFKNDGVSIKLKVSMGVVSLSTDLSCDDADKLLGAVDKALERAKSSGGNSVIAYSELYQDTGKKAPKIKAAKEEGVRVLKRKIKKLSENVDRMTLDSIYAFSRSLEARDNYTGEHAEKTIAIARRIGKALGMSEDSLDVMEKGAVLHDIGKIGISDAILRKKARLTPDEFRMIKTHPKIGAEIIRVIHFLKDVVPVVLYHHERWDGKGYPSGLKGTEIPLPARIVALADAYQALTSDRPYRKAYPKKEALAILRKESGSHFDKKLVDLLVRMEMKKNKS